MKRVVVIGSGIHYRDKYHSVLKKKGVEIALLIDLESQRENILQYLQSNLLIPKQTLFLDEVYRNTITLDQIETLTRHLDLSQIEGALICTEPKVRKPYAIWAARQGWDLFMDKPVTAFSSNGGIESLLDDFDEILASVNEFKVNAVVSCERRSHLGYHWLSEYIQELMRKEKLILTGIDIHFAGGVWRTLSEFLFCENHPFKYGYGVLLHSGYHYVDLLVQLLKFNDLLISSCHLRLHAFASRPLDQLKRESSFSSIASLGDFSGFGETDFLMIGQSLKEDSVVTNFSLKLCGTSMSTRQDTECTPKLKGRIRQENVILHFGHHCSIHIQSLATKKLEPLDHSIEHFNITILNSPFLQNRDRVIHVDREMISKIFPFLSLSTSMNTYARQFQLEEFLSKRDGNSSLPSHRDTVSMLQTLYRLL